MENFSGLKRGDIVRNLGSGNTYVIDINGGNFCIAVNTVYMSNPLEWCTPLKDNTSTSTNILRKEVKNETIRDSPTG